MKRLPRRFAALLVILLLWLPAVAVRAQEPAPIKVVLGGRALVTDVPPVIIDGRVMVPLRSIFEALDAVVGWDPQTRRIVAIRGDVKVELTVGSTEALVNGKPVQMSVPPQIVNGRTLVPVRFVSEVLGDKVEWDGASRTVRVSRTPLGPSVTTALMVPEDLPFAGYKVLEAPFGRGWTRHFVQGNLEEGFGELMLSVGMAHLPGDPAYALNQTPCQPNEKLHSRPRVGDAARVCHLTRNGKVEVTVSVAWRDRVIMVTVYDSEDDFEFAFGLALAMVRQQLEILEQLAAGKPRPALAVLDAALTEGLLKRAPKLPPEGEDGPATGTGTVAEVDPARLEGAAAEELARLVVLEFPTTPERFEVGALGRPGVATAGEPYAFSFCDPAVDDATDLCGWPRAVTPKGGRSPYRFYSKSGFPAIGLALLANGLLTGTPSAGAGGREYPFVVCAADLAGAEICLDTVLTVAPARAPAVPLQFYIADDLPWGRVSQPYRHSFCDPEPVGGGACGGRGSTEMPTGGVPPYTFRLKEGALPPGMALSANGVLSGTPGPGRWRNDLTICAADSAGTEICRAETLWINQNTLAVQLQNSSWKGTFTVQHRHTNASFTGSFTFKVGTIPSAKATTLTLSDVTVTFHESLRVQRANIYCPAERADCAIDIAFYGPNGASAHLAFQYSANSDLTGNGTLSPTAMEGTAFYMGRIGGRFTAARQ